MRELPTGTVTFLFTDIEGSTRLLQELGTDGYAQLQERHARILRAAIARGRGVRVRTEGDSFFAVFPWPSGAVEAAVEAQLALATDVPTIRVRMGLHTGGARIEQDSDLRFPEQAAVQYGDPEADAHASLGDDAFARARAEGFAMTPDQVVDLLMAAVPPGGSSP